MAGNSETSDPGPIRAEGLDALDGTTPWRTPASLPEKPEAILYGVKYRDHPKLGNKTLPLESPRELLGEIEAEGSRIDFVFLPGEDRGVPLRSLNLFRALNRSDFRRHFQDVLVNRGFVGLAAVAGSQIFQNEFSFPLLIFGLLFGLVPTFDALIQWFLFPANRAPEELKRSLVHGVVFRDWIQSSPRSRFPVWVMVGIFVLVNLAQLHRGLGDLLAVSSSGWIRWAEIRDAGEWWRLFTGPLMHGNLLVVLHVGFNSAALVYLGRFVHRIAHPLMNPVIFTVSAFVGAVASTIFSGDRPSLGASGGVVGLLGFLAFLVFARPSLPLEFRTLTIRNLFLLVVIGVGGISFIDNAGHGGGLVGGALCGLVYHLCHRDRWDVPTTPTKLVLGLLSSVPILFGFAACLDLFLFQGQTFVRDLPRFRW